MGNKIIVRCPAGISPQERQRLLELVKQTAGLSFTEQDIEFVDPAKDEAHKNIFARRINALADGAKALFDCIPGNQHSALENKLEKLRESHLSLLRQIAKSKFQDDINYYQNALVAYKNALIDFWVNNIGGMVPQGAKKRINFNEKNIMHWLDRAEQYALGPRPALCTISQSKDGSYLVQVEKPLPPCSQQTREEFFAAAGDDKAKWPAWFRCMDLIEQMLFRKKMQGVTEENFNQHFNAFSSKHDSLPVARNFSKHTFMEISADPKAKEQVEFVRQEMRSSHIATRSIKQNDVRKDFANRNLEHIFLQGLTEQNVMPLHALPASQAEFKKLPVLPVLLQTLITPMLQPDGALHADKKTAVIALQKKYADAVVQRDGKFYRLQFISTNHIANLMRFVTPTRPGSSTGKAGLELATLADEWAIVFTNQGKYDVAAALQQAAIQLRDLINHVSRRSDRELHLAGVERFISHTIWTAAGFKMPVGYHSCVSGKDREAVAKMFADALGRFSKKHNHLPDLRSKTERAEFAKSYAEIYCTHHQHSNANQNALGANGIKTPSYYLPGYLKDAIKQRYQELNQLDLADSFHRRHDLLATNNDFENIKPAKAAPMVHPQATVSTGLKPVAIKAAYPVVNSDSAPLDENQKAKKQLEESQRIKAVTKVHDVLETLDKSKVHGVMGILGVRIRFTNKGVRQMRNILKNDPLLHEKLGELNQLLLQRVADAREKKELGSRIEGAQAFYNAMYNVVSALNEGREVNEKAVKNLEHFRISPGVAA